LKARVVINPIAGPGRIRTLGSCIELAKSVLGGHGVDADIHITGGPSDAFRLAREGVDANCDLVIVWGGDGTVNGAATACAETTVPLAIIPGGSGNGLARDLSLPLNARQAFTIAATGGVRQIDGGDLHGSLFFNVAGVGFDARIADRLAQPGARRGLVGYIIATVSEMRAYEPGAYSIRNAYDVDGKQHLSDIIDHPALFIALANSRQYGSGAQIAPKALLDDGMIEIVVVEPQSGFSIMRQVPAFFRGTLQEGPGLLMRSAASMDISSAHPIKFHVDGEPRTGPTTIRLANRRRILSVKVSH
jgi:YegS/Rv2252/BmrU family lipid kinase